MPRKPRLDFPGAVHHVMNRGARRAALFAEAWVCQLFLAVLAELPERFNVQILAYAIMPNHYHLLLECPDGNLSRAMQYLGAEFTQRLNRIQAWDGPVFRGRFLSRLVDSDAYFAHVLAYIHLNPVRANLAPNADAARWTSHPALLGHERRPAWLSAGTVDRLFGNTKTYLDYLAACLGESPPMPAGWDPDHLWRGASPPPETPARPQAADVEALLAAVATAAGVPRSVLRTARAGRRGNPARAFAAWWLGRRTTLTNGQIGEHLGCSAARVSQLRRAVPRQTRRFAELTSRAATASAAPDPATRSSASVVRAPVPESTVTSGYTYYTPWVGPSFAVRDSASLRPFGAGLARPPGGGGAGRRWEPTASPASPGSPASFSGIPFMGRWIQEERRGCRRRAHRSTSAVEEPPAAKRARRASSSPRRRCLGETTTADAQELTFPVPTTTKVTLTVTEVMPGATSPDLCLSEVVFSP